MRKKKIAIVGTQGIPSQYGGFETLVEYLADFLSEKFEITIFCSAKVYKTRLSEYKGCKLEFIPFHANGIQSIPFDILSIIKSRKRFDKVLILGASGGVIMPFLRGSRDKFILNFGGLDWKRAKWGFFTQKFLKLSESLAIKNSTYLISDNKGIQEYIKNKYNRDSIMIAYGGEQVLSIKPNANDYIKYSFLKEPYAFSVARIQPDNNINMILEAFVNNTPMPIVFVGNWKSSKYGLATKEIFSTYKNIILLDAIYDQQELDLLRSNCAVYIHGHSAGGTNPSLVEAMNLGLLIFAFSSGFNEFTTENKARYFASSVDLQQILKNTKQMELIGIGSDMKSIAKERYQWKIITDKYSEIFEK